MTKATYRAAEKRRQKTRALERFQSAHPRPFEETRNWVLCELADLRARGLGLEGAARKAWRVRALAEIELRLEHMDTERRYCLLPWVAKRPATEAEKEAVEIDRQWLEERTREDDQGCWVWTGHVTKQGQPQARVSVLPGVHATMLTRRLVARMKWKPSAQFPTVADFYRDRQAGVPASCSPGCCHPDHVSMRSKTAAMDNRRGVPLPLEHKMRISAAKRKNSKIDDATIRAILQDPRPGRHIAAELGVHASYIPHVRTGKLRAYSAVGDGLFAGLL